jgi:hypothetical protein
MSEIFQYVQQHSMATLVVSGYIGTAIIATMPAKGEPISFYSWLYDFLHLLLNTKQGNAMLQKFNIPAGTQVTQSVSPTQTTTTISNPAQETK